MISPRIFLRGAFFAASFGVVWSATSAHAQIDIPLQPSGPLVSPLEPGQATPAPAASAKPASEYTDAEVRALGQGVAFPYSLLDRIYDRVVTKDGDITYLRLKNDNDLQLYVRALAIADTDKFPVFKVKDEKGVEIEDRTTELAFWVNAYNALFLNAIAEKYPVNSVGEIKNLDDATTRIVGGQKYSFGELRKKIAKLDPRALFLLIDGTQSGPRAPQGAARFIGLGAQMNGAIKAFVDDPMRVGSPNRDENKVEVSPWLESVDAYFAGGARRRKHEGIRNLLAGYTSNSGDRRYFSAGEYEVKFMTPNKKINAALARE